MKISNDFNEGFLISYFYCMKKIGKIEITLNTDFMFAKNQQIINEELFKSKSKSQDYGFEMRTNFKKYPNLTIGYDKSYSTFISTINTSKFTTTSPEGE